MNLNVTINRPNTLRRAVRHALHIGMPSLLLAVGLTACNDDDNETKIVAVQPADNANAGNNNTNTGNNNGNTNTTPANTSLNLALLETTDLHTNILSYDYYKLAEDKSLGLERTATLIKQARQDYPNNVLLDDGDTIQGTALADYQAVINPVKCDETLAIYKVMNDLKFDAGTIGNHEFNYGLNFLNQVTGSQFNVDGVTNRAQPCQGPNFPLVLSNVWSVKSGQPLFKPYQIITKTFTATKPDGSQVQVPIKIGVIGFTTPGIMTWDKNWLEGKVTTQGAKEMAEKYVPQMRKEGADIVVALSHGGLDTSGYSPTMENASYYIAQVPGIDALFMGHSHQSFPDKNSTNPNWNAAGVDKEKGTIHGVPATMANQWGRSLGVIKLNLVYDGQKWNVKKDATEVELRNIQNADKTYVAADPQVSKLVADAHQATINYVKTPIGTTNFPMTSYFADVGDVSAIQVVNQAQANYVADYINANLPQYKGVPVLSVSAPFKSGYAGANDFTDVAQGNVAINNAADLYLYPNTVSAVMVTGSDIKKWLENAAKRFNKIDPNKKDTQYLTSTFPGYNFDIFTTPDVHYEIDVTQPVGSRIKNLTYQGQPMADTAKFIIATNNYRASGLSKYAGIADSKTIYSAPDANRDVLIDYIKAVKNLTRAQNGSARSWQFTKVMTQGPVLFKSAPNKIELAKAAGINNVIQLNNDDGQGKGLADYQIDLSK